MNVKELINNSITKLTNAGIDPAEARAEVDLLVKKILNLSKKDLIVNPQIQTTHSNSQRIIDIIEKRASQRMPIQYLLGTADFYGLEFVVNNDVLIPRQETELLVKLVSDYLTTVKNAVITEVGVGSGCISVTIATLVKDLTVIATDISTDAIKIASANAKNHQVSDRIEFINTNILDGITQNIDALVSNPPYVAVDKLRDLQKEVREYEPHLALCVTANDPCEFYKKIIAQGTKLIKSGGLIAFEIDPELASEICEILNTYNYMNITVHKDLNALDRVITAIKS